MNNIVTIYEIVNGNLEQTKNRNDLKQDIYSIYERISFDLNSYSINNKIFNLKDLYGLNDHFLILIYDDKSKKYFLVDLSLPTNFFEIDDDIFTIYLSKFDICNNNLLLDDIYLKRTNGR